MSFYVFQSSVKKIRNIQDNVSQRDFQKVPVCFISMDKTVSLVIYGNCLAG